MTKVLDVAAHPQLSEILGLIDEGNAVILTRDGRQVAEVKPVEEEVEQPRRERVFGLNRGAISYITDDFDAELPESFWMGEE